MSNELYAKDLVVTVRRCCTVFLADLSKPGMLYSIKVGSLPQGVGLAPSPSPPRVLISNSCLLNSPLIPKWLGERREQPRSVRLSG